MAIIQRLAQDEGLYLANSMNSLRLEGQKTASIEIAQQFDWQVPDVVIVPGGNLGNISAFAAGFEMMRDLGLVARVPRLIAAQAEAANPLYLASETGWQFDADGRAVRRWPPRFRLAIPCRSTRRLPRCSGAAASWSRRASRSSPTPWRAPIARACSHVRTPASRSRRSIKLAARGEIKRDERVVVISTASGLKFTEFKAAYHAW